LTYSYFIKKTWCVWLFTSNDVSHVEIDRYGFLGVMPIDRTFMDR